MHYTRWKRHGDPNIVLASGPPFGNKHWHWINEDVRYIGMHKRIYVERGSASLYQCSAVGCVSQASQWAYDHADPDEKSEMQTGYLVSYSIHMEHYNPLCVPCHKKSDLQLKEKNET
jgi:hypothetical protein